MPTTTERGLGWAHQRRRALFAQRLPLPCSRCGQPVESWHDWHLDHTTPRSKGGTASESLDGKQITALTVSDRWAEGAGSLSVSVWALS